MVVSAAPLLGLARVNPVAQLVSSRGALAAGTLGLAAILGLWFLVGLLRQLHANRNFPAISLFLAVALGLTGAANLAVMKVRGLESAALVSVAELAEITPAAGEVTVVAFNTHVNRPGAAATAELVLAAQAAAVLLPETPLSDARAIADLLGAAGQVYQVFPDYELDRRSTALLVAESFGTYIGAGSPMIGAVRAAPAGEGPLVTAVHPIRPAEPWPLSALYGSPANGPAHQKWAGEVREAMSACAAAPFGILGGDFNATRDHTFTLPDCGYVDVLAASGAGGWGTWPTELPAWLGTPIDRILVDPAHWVPVAGWVIDVPGSDHRAVVARLGVVARE